MLQADVCKPCMTKLSGRFLEAGKHSGRQYAVALAPAPWWAQICGGFPDAMARCAQLIEEHAAMDFVDINMGCPIDIICNRCGSAERQGGP